MKPHWAGLVGDVGGTNARFALVDSVGHIRNPRSFACKDYPSLDAIVAEYIETTVGKKRPPKAVIAVAGPVLDGEIEFTNLDWRVSEGDLLARAVALIPDGGAVVKGESLAALPPSVLAVMESDRNGGSFRALQNATLGEWDITTPYAITGSRTLTLDVQD